MGRGVRKEIRIRPSRIMGPYWFMNITKPSRSEQGQEGEDHLRAVERGNGDQVEDEEQGVGEGAHDY